MAFWSRYLVLMLLCIAAPFGAALYADTQSEIARAGIAGTLSAKVAPRALNAQLTLEAHHTVNQALAIAQSIAAEGIFADLVGKPLKRAAASKRLSSLVDGAKTEAPAFVWVLDDTGAIITRNGQADLEENPELVSGHPLFLSTQQGYALDGYWKKGDELFIVGAAPVSINGDAHGAVFVGRPVDRTLVEWLASQSSVSLTVVIGNRVLVSTLPHDVAESIVDKGGELNEPKLGGSLSIPLTAGPLPFLPLFVRNDLAGLAYTSIAAGAPGSETIRWVMSVPAAEVLRDVPNRQQNILGGFAVAMLLALMIGLVLQRTFVTPLSVIAAHLADLQQGRGDRELSEHRVSGPFRRLVRLINMVVQKLPSRGYEDPSSHASLALGSLPPPPDLSEHDGGRLGAIPSDVAQLGFENLPSEPPPPLPSLVPSVRSMTAPPPPSPSTSGSMKPLTLTGLNLQPSSLGSGFGSSLGSPSFAANPLANAHQEPIENELDPGTDPFSPMPSPIPSGASKNEKRSASDIRGLPSTSIGSTSSSGIRGVPGEALKPAGKPASGIHAAPPTAPLSSGGYGGPSAPSLSAINSGLPVPSAVPTQLGRSTPTIQLSNPPQAPSAFGREDPLRGMSLEGGFGREATPIGGSGGSGGMVGAPPPKPSGPRMGGTAAMPSQSGLGSAGIADYFESDDSGGFRSEATVVSAPGADLIAKSARDFTNVGYPVEEKAGDRTVVASVPQDLLAQSAQGGLDGGNGDLDAAEHAHFKETYERFVEMRKKCGEPTADLAFDRFVAKLKKNRDGLIQKYSCKTVRFQVYQKDGKAALKATPVKESELRR